jgi:hypothetical protein
MSNGRGKKETRYAEATPEGIKVAKRLIKEGKLAGPAGKLTPAQENELDSYNKFVEKVADSMGPTMGIGMIRPAQILKGRLTGPTPKRFKRPDKKPVLKTGTKEKIKGLTQDMADGGEVFNMSTEMVIDE